MTWWRPSRSPTASPSSRAPPAPSRRSRRSPSAARGTSSTSTRRRGSRRSTTRSGTTSARRSARCGRARVTDVAPAREAALLAQEAARARAAARVDRRRVLGWQGVLLGALLLAWSVASGRLVDRLFLSDPLAVARAFWNLLLKGTLWFH